MNKKLLVLALGGNALLRRGEPAEFSLMQKNIIAVAKQIAEIAADYKILIVHGNGPQIGLLALQNSNYKAVQGYPLDVLDAQSQGMIGYPLQQALQNFTKNSAVVTVLTQVVVSQDDKSFKAPSKFIGTFYNESESKNLIIQQGWKMKQDGELWRRVVASPKPIEVVEICSILTLLNANKIVIAAGGGGVPCVRKNNCLQGIAAVIDKDYSAALLAKKLKADKFLVLTDVDSVYKNYGTAQSKPISQISVSELKKLNFAAGSMLPKVEAVCDFVLTSQKSANIGALGNLQKILQNKSGTMIYLN